MTVRALALAMLLGVACTSAPTAPELSPTAAVPVDPSTTGSPMPPAVASTPSPAPVRERFAGRVVTPLPPAIAAEMHGTTWHPGCPIPLSDLALLRFNHEGLDGSVKRGSMVVNAAVAEDVLWVFGRLFDARFPLKRVALAIEYHPLRDERRPNTRHSVTASFNCRPIVLPDGPGNEWSQHAYGLAVDVNPLQNPYVAADGWVRNRFARPYVDRSRDLPGMIHAGDVVTRAFDAIGWAWGGRWGGGRDYMHFSLTGR